MMRRAGIRTAHMSRKYCFVEGAFDANAKRGIGDVFLDARIHRTAGNPENLTRFHLDMLNLQNINCCLCHFLADQHGGHAVS